MPPARCAVHPVRPAVDACPGCGRARCARDARAAGPDCAACRPPAAPPAGPPVGPGLLEALVRAALAALPVALAGAAITSEYVGAHVFSVLTPALLGVACGVAATAAARVPAGTARHRAVRAVAVLYALVGTGYAFRFVVGGPSPFSPAGQVGPPYLAAALGAWLWTLPAGRRQLPAGRATRS